VKQVLAKCSTQSCFSCRFLLCNELSGSKLLTLVKGLSQFALMMLFERSRKIDRARPGNPVKVFLLITLCLDKALDMSLFFHQEGIAIAFENIVDVLLANHVCRYGLLNWVIPSRIYLQKLRY